MVHNPLIGAWKLVDYTCKAGNRDLDSPLGPSPVGYILYTADGHMSVQIAAAERPHFATGDLLGGTSAEKETAADSYIAYCGTYTLFADRVVHHVEQSFFPNRTGTAQTRYYTLEGNRLELTTPPILIDGAEQVCRISWERTQ